MWYHRHGQVIRSCRCETPFDLLYDRADAKPHSIFILLVRSCRCETPFDLLYDRADAKPHSISYTIVQMRNPIRSPIRTCRCETPFFLQKPVFFDFLSTILMYTVKNKKTSEKSTFGDRFADAKNFLQMRNPIAINVNMSIRH